MTPQALKSAILQLAIQGKLVPQRPEEGSAAPLLRPPKSSPPRTPKSSLPRSLKFSVPSSPFPPGTEPPFDIPESWRWAKIGEIFDLINGKAFKPSDWSNQGLPIIRIQNLNDAHAPLNHFAGPIEEKYILHGGELLFSWSGTPGTSFGAFIWQGGKAVLNQHIFIMHPRIKIDYEYAKLALNAELPIFISKAHGAAGLQHITRKEFDACYLPIPPIPEQHRIVAKIEELLPLVDRYEQAWTQLEDFNRRFPADMQKSLRQLAIQGKLVEQRPEEGTGEQLYRKILSAKKSSSPLPSSRPASRLKSAVRSPSSKQKPLPPITEDEIPFEIPDSWKWYRIGDLFKIVNGFTPQKTKPEFWTNGDIPWFTIEDVHRQGRFITSTEKFITRSALAKGTERIVPADTVLLCCTASVGEYAYTKIPLTTNQQFNAFVVKPHCQSVVYPLYVFEFVKTLKGNLIDRAGKTTFNYVSVGKLANMLIPLPPLAEQKRIVAKLEELLPLCERLKLTH